MKANGSDYGQRQPTTAPATRGAGLRPLKEMFNDDYVKRRFHEVLGEKSAGFLASVLNATRLNPKLNECEPGSVMSAAMVAATLDLPVDPSLGFSAIVPYYDKKKKATVAQFQIMTKGFVQLALRSGQYRTINVGPIYEDEFESYDIISGEVRIHPVDGGYRDKDDQSKIIGYVAFFRLLNGFERVEFWSNKKIEAHGKRFSKTYDYDTGMWKTDFPSMAAKTVLKNTLSKWGILSTTMQTAMKTDQASIRDFDGKTLKDEDLDYVDATVEGESTIEGQEGASGAKDDSKPVQAPNVATAQREPQKAEPSRASVPPVSGNATAKSDDGLFSDMDTSRPATEADGIF